MKRRAAARLLGSGLLAILFAHSADAQAAKRRLPPREAEDDEEHVEQPIPFPQPAAEMQKLAFLAGTWDLRETWADPRRYKRGKYEGFPGEEGFGTVTIRQGPGSFSLVWEYDERNPMGHVTGQALLSWDPARHVYDYFEVHSALPGALRLTGSFEEGKLVFRGEDNRTGERTSVRLVFKDLSTGGWTQTFEEARKGGQMEAVVTTVARRSVKK
jgi:hypothetical protein